MNQAPTQTGGEPSLFSPAACGGANRRPLPHEGPHAAPLNALPRAAGLNNEPAAELNIGRGSESLVRGDGEVPPVIPAGWPEEVVEGCVRLDPAAVLKATPRSFVLRVRGCSMIGADIHDGDLVIGEFTPEARPGAIVVALIDGESTLKRFVLRQGRPYLASENPSCPDFVPLSELVIQGVVHTVVKRAG